MTHPEAPWQFQGTVKRPRSGQWPNSWKPPPLLQNRWNNAYEITQPIKTNHTTFGGCTHSLPWPTLCLCSSLNLNKSTSYRSLCLLLNSFCDETSRTWASLSPETRYHGFSWVRVPDTWAHVPGKVLAGFKSQFEVSGFKNRGIIFFQIPFQPQTGRFFSKIHQRNRLEEIDFQGWVLLLMRSRALCASRHGGFLLAVPHFLWVRLQLSRPSLSSKG